jgi:hypothetical protein
MDAKTRAANLTRFLLGRAPLPGELLRHEDRIAAIFDGVRAIQEDINLMRNRIESVENSMMRSRMEMAHG